MKFTIQHKKDFPKCKMRMAKLSELKRHPDKVFSTPMLLLYTKGGSVTHLTREVLSMITDISTEAIQIPLSNSAQCHNALKLFKDGISHFAGLPECLSYCTLQDPGKETKTGYNEKTCSTIWTHTGRLQLTSEKYMNMIEAFKPDMYHSLCDGDTNVKSTRKRALKSVDVTTKMFAECLEIHNKSEILKHSVLLAVLEGGYDLEARQNSAQLFANTQVQGFVIDGLHNNGPGVEFISYQTIEPVIKETLKHLPDERLRVIHGGWRPDVVLELINAGVDVFDTSIVYFATQRCCAFTFTYRVLQVDELENNIQQTDRRCDEAKSIWTDFDTDIKSEKGNTSLYNVNENYEINLKDKKYFEDLTPISSKCKCLTCTKHTRSYIHHLINSNEMLASVLLMIHNLHHYQQFFEDIRENGMCDRLLTIEPSIS